MKLLSVAVPCYNSAEYMENCINSLLKGGEDVEILIVDDGSVKDNTAEIADRLQEQYPTIIKSIHQDNGGHGEAVNTGLANATGVFFKVVDSDDWVNEEALNKILQVLKKAVEKDVDMDMLLSNFVYEKQGVKHKKTMRYKGALPERKLVEWGPDIKFKTAQYILMHSVIYRTKMLRDCGLKLPKHTFYVDNIYVFQPLPSVRKVYYLNVDFYRYFIGRDDQSVNEKVMISRIDQQIRVTKIMIDEYLKMNIECKNLDKYMLQYLDMMMCVSSIMLILSKEKINLEKKKELWNYLENSDKELYKKLRHTILGVWMNLPGAVGRKFSVLGYKIAQKIVGFN